MKEASGEANLTVITIILIGVIVAVATPIINSMMTNTAKRTCCQNAGGIWEGTTCYSINANGTKGQAKTDYWDSKTNSCTNK